MTLCRLRTSALYAVLVCIHVTVVIGKEQTLVDINLSEQTNANLSRVKTTPKPSRWSDGIQMGCKRLRSKRYISDGFCTSKRPIVEAVCAGQCLPVKNLPWYATHIKVWSRSKLVDWRCEEGVVKRRKVKLLCENGETRTYKIKIVKSCNCKKYRRAHNGTDIRRGRSKTRRKSRRNRRRRRKGRRKLQVDL